MKADDLQSLPLRQRILFWLVPSAPRAPGFDLLLDYVHPTQTGNRIVAKAVQNFYAGRLKHSREFYEAGS